MEGQVRKAENSSSPIRIHQQIHLAKSARTDPGTVRETSICILNWSNNQKNSSFWRNSLIAPVEQVRTMRIRLRSKLCVVTTAAFTATVFLPPVSAATQVLEEVVVTAQRREQNLQDNDVWGVKG